MTLIDSILNLIATPAYAAAPAPHPQGGGMSMILMLVVLVLFMYFVMWRPQSKRAKEQRDLLNSLSKGDEVMTIGGIIGKVAKISDQYVVLAISDTVEIMIQKSAISSALPKGTMKTISA